MPSKPALVTLIGFVLIATLVLLAVTSYFWVQIPFIKFRLHANECKWGPPLAGVYLSSRLKLVDRCITVTGTVDCLKADPNGDFHIRLRLDSQYTRRLLRANSLRVLWVKPSLNVLAE